MSNYPSRNRLSTHCPQCGQLVSVNSQACSNCGLPVPGVYRKMPVLGDLILGELSFVNHIVLACFVLYGLSLALDLPNVSIFGGIFNILSPTSQTLFRLGMGGAIPLATGRWWSLITATYLHGGLLHIAFNMLWLRQLGPLVEDLFGASRFWIIYTVAGLTGALVSTGAGTSFFVGASGAVFGLFGALIFYGRHRGGTFGSGIFRQMVIWAGIGFFLGFAMPGVDNWGHLGGFIGGLIAAISLGYNERVRQRFWQHILATFLLLGVAISFVMMVIFFFVA